MTQGYDAKAYRHPLKPVDVEGLFWKAPDIITCMHFCTFSANSQHSLRHAWLPLLHSPCGPQLLPALGSLVFARTLCNRKTALGHAWPWPYMDLCVHPALELGRVERFQLWLVLSFADSPSMLCGLLRSVCYHTAANPSWRTQTLLQSYR